MKRIARFDGETKPPMKYTWMLGYMEGDSRNNEPEPTRSQCTYDLNLRNLPMCGVLLFMRALNVSAMCDVAIVASIRNYVLNVFVYLCR